MDESNPYQAPQVDEPHLPLEAATRMHAGDAVPADFTMWDLLLVLGVTGLMILIALAVPYVLATILGR